MSATAACCTSCSACDRAGPAVPPQSGASWEGYAIEEVLRLAKPDEAYFWATHTGAELDLLLISKAGAIGIEVKRAGCPAAHAFHAHRAGGPAAGPSDGPLPGRRGYDLADRVTVLPLARLAAGDAAALMPQVRRRLGTTTGRQDRARRRTR